MVCSFMAIHGENMAMYSLIVLSILVFCSHKLLDLNSFQPKVFLVLIWQCPEKSFLKSEAPKETLRRPQNVHFVAFLG